MVLKYDIEISEDAIKANFDRICSRIFKLLPDREEGKDWKTEDPDSKYYLHRYTLQKMMKDYPEVDVQESRNGYIIHKTALETGIIYTYP